jgi:hypothetical protein
MYIVSKFSHLLSSVRWPDAPGPRARRAAPKTSVRLCAAARAPTVRAEPPSRFRPPGTVLGAQEIFNNVNPYGKYFLGPDNIPGVGIARAGAERGCGRGVRRWGFRKPTVQPSRRRPRLSGPARRADRGPGIRSDQDGCGSLIRTQTAHLRPGDHDDHYRECG